MNDQLRSTIVRYMDDPNAYDVMLRAEINGTPSNELARAVAWAEAEVAIFIAANEKRKAKAGARMTNRMNRLTDVRSMMVAEIRDR